MLVSDDLVYPKDGTGEASEKAANIPQLIKPSHF